MNDQPTNLGSGCWYPKENMSFGAAIDALKRCCRVARKGWNGNGMWLAMASDWTAKVGNGMPMLGDWQGFSPFIVMYTADKKLIPWLASQTDMLAVDWLIVE